MHLQDIKNGSDGVHVQVMLDDGCDGVLYDDGDEASLDNSIDGKSTPW